MTESKTAERCTIREWLSRRFVWRIPVYQRHYSWGASTRDSGPVQLFWETVKEQVEARLKDASQPPSKHYLGAVLVDNKTPDSVDDIKRFDVVDGQQRLTTIQIALFSLIQIAKDHNCEKKFQEDLAKYIFADSVSHSDHAVNSGVNPKLNPTNFDKVQFEQILYYAYNRAPSPVPRGVMNNQDRSKALDVFEFFCDQMRTLLDNFDKPKSDMLTVLQDTLLDGFELYLIVLNKTDKAQKIFASMNNTAKPLTTFDLIRNDVFYRASKKPGEDERLFNTDNWQMLERPFWEQSSEKRKDGIPHIDAYIARMLVAKLKKSNFGFNRTDLFKTYQEFGRKCGNVEKEIGLAVEYTDIYKHLMSEPHNDPALQSFDFGVFMFDKWPNKDFYPVIFSILTSTGSENEKQAMLTLLESYVIRRNMCGLTSNRYNLMAFALCRELGDSARYQTLRDLLLKDDADTSRFPDDRDVGNGCNLNPFFRSLFPKYVLEKMNDALYEDGEARVVNTKLTIDHVLPQKWAENKSWAALLLGSVSPEEAESRKAIINAYVHTVGNLTLLSGPTNSKKSNHSFSEFKSLLKKSDLLMNRDLADKSEWDEKAIMARSSQFADIICKRWPRDVRFGD
ncbi:MAG: DUF262 domain-containing HNH endonuclease family protein [Gammaproteobacteria bacterium]|nr:DUF262 domain-containing HNH endonuclease family protein [Gammaproteobacteria bacterium]MDA8023990.1 DUF262 domain-containing HNH endonuclease family protein [Gammaproteobacteria bacterium]